MTIAPPPLLGDDVANIADEDNDNDWDTTCLSKSNEETEDAKVGLDKEEAKECAYFLKYKETHNVDKSIFTLADLEEMKSEK